MGRETCGRPRPEGGDVSNSYGGSDGTCANCHRDLDNGEQHGRGICAHGKGKCWVPRCKQEGT